MNTKFTLIIIALLIFTCSCGGGGGEVDATGEGGEVTDVDVEEIHAGQCMDDAECDDEIACTVDVCNRASGECEHHPNDSRCAAGEYCDPTGGCISLPCTRDEDCDDGLFCNGEEICAGSGEFFSCQTGAPPNCDDGIYCTRDYCNEETDQCTHEPLDSRCDPGEICDPVYGCVDQSRRCTDDSDCDNGLFCDGQEYCEGNICWRGAPPDCSDEILCTMDLCDEGQDRCISLPNDADCNDGLFCNGEEICDPVNGDPETGCLTGINIPSCNDGDDCTSDICSEEAGRCIHTPADRDGDGFGDILCGGTDCDDLDPEINPSAEEVCDGIDNDCDRIIDEGFTCSPGETAECTTPCHSTGVMVCDATCRFGDCQPPEEVCNQLDDDCDGQIDEGLTNSCGVCAPEPEGLGQPCDGGCGIYLCDETGTSVVCDRTGCIVNILLVRGHPTLTENAKNALEQLWHNVTVIDGNQLDEDFSYSPYEVVIFTLYSEIADPQKLIAENERGNIGIAFFRGDNLAEEFAIAESFYYQNGNFTIANNTHTITEIFPIGNLELSFEYKTEVINIHPGNIILGNSPSPSLVVNSTYRRVVSPYYGHWEGMPWSENARILVDRIVRWAAGRL